MQQVVWPCQEVIESADYWSEACIFDTLKPAVEIRGISPQYCKPFGLPQQAILNTSLITFCEGGHDGHVTVMSINYWRPGQSLGTPLPGQWKVPRPVFQERDLIHHGMTK